MVTVLNEGTSSGQTPVWDGTSWVASTHGTTSHNTTVRPFYYTISTLGLGNINKPNSTSQSGVVARVFMAPFEVPRTMTFDRIGFIIQTAGGVGTTSRLGIYPSTSGIPDATTLVLDAGTVVATGTGFIEATINQQLAAGLYFAALETEDTTIKFERLSDSGAVSAATPKLHGCYYTLAGPTYGALSTTCPTTTAATSASVFVYLRVASVDD